MVLPLVPVPVSVRGSDAAPLRLTPDVRITGDPVAGAFLADLLGAAEIAWMRE